MQTVNKYEPEIEELKRLVVRKYGKELFTTTDFESFSFYLERETGAAISASTLKRLWGYVSDRHQPRRVSLDILAQYLGYRDFSNFIQWLKTTTSYNSSFFDANQLLSSTLETGMEVEIGWSPNRYLRLTYLGESRYEVTDSRNSKLQPGDRFVTGCFIKEQPLYLPFIEREGGNTAAFVAGRNGGLTIVRRVEE